MATTHAIVEVEREYHTLLHDPRRPLSRFVELSLQFGRMLTESDPDRAADVLAVALDTLHDPPAPAEAEMAFALARSLGVVAAALGRSHDELDSIQRERRLIDDELVVAQPGWREDLCRRAAVVRFSEGDVAAGFGELIDAMRSSTSDVRLDATATDLVVAARRYAVDGELAVRLEELWIDLRRSRSEGRWPVWCLTALAALRLGAGDLLSAQMYVRRAEAIVVPSDLEQIPVPLALASGWVAMAGDELERAVRRFSFVLAEWSGDERLRLLASAGIGEAYVRLGRNELARAPLAEAISFELGDPATLARCHELLAELAAAEGRFADAYTHLRTTRRLEQSVASPGRAAGSGPLTPFAPGSLALDSATPSEVVDLRNPAQRRSSMSEAC